MAKFKGINDATDISIKMESISTIFRKMSLMTLMASLKED